MEVQLHSTIRPRYVTVLDCLKRVNTFLAEKRLESRRSASRHVTSAAGDDSDEYRRSETPNVLPVVGRSKSDTSSLPPHLAVYDHLLRAKYNEQEPVKSLPALPQRGKWAQPIPYENQLGHPLVRSQSRIIRGPSAVRPEVLRFGGSTLTSPKHPRSVTPGLPEDWKLKGKGRKSAASEGSRTARKSRARHSMPFTASVNARKDIKTDKDCNKEIKQSYICISQPLHTLSPATSANASPGNADTSTTNTIAEGEDNGENVQDVSKTALEKSHEQSQDATGNNDNISEAHDIVEDNSKKSESEEPKQQDIAVEEDSKSSEISLPRPVLKGLSPRFKLPRRVRIIEPAFILEQNESNETSSESEDTLEFLITNSTRQT
jgi:hypothetical protein